MSSVQTSERPKSYLRPNQREELEGEVRSMENMLTDPMLRAKIGSPGELMRARNKAKQMLETQTPRALPPEKRDAAARREKELRGKITEGMPSYGEMRGCPPGAIGKHRRWETANKERIQEWKRLRFELDPDNTDPDLANVETLRPRSNTLNMHNAIVQGTDYYLPSGPIEAKNVASDEDRERWDREREEFEARERAYRMELETLREAGNDPSAPRSNIVSASDAAPEIPCGKKVTEGYETRHIARCMKRECVVARSATDGPEAA